MWVSLVAVADEGTMRVRFLWVPSSGFRVSRLGGLHPKLGLRGGGNPSLAGAGGSGRPEPGNPS